MLIETLPCLSLQRLLRWPRYAPLLLSHALTGPPFSWPNYQPGPIKRRAPSIVKCHIYAILLAGWIGLHKLSQPNAMRASIPPGIRVVRGPNWIWSNQGKNAFRQPRASLFTFTHLQRGELTCHPLSVYRYGCFCYIVQIEICVR